MESSHRLGIKFSDEISKLRSDIHTSLARSIKGFEHLESGSLEAKISPELHIHKLLARSIKGFEHPESGSPEAEISPELPRWLSKLQNESIFLQKQVNIISSLHYSRISERERNVMDPHPRTYDWLFEDPQNPCESQSASNVLNWLHAGRDVFWVSGKAGSGKSVLMKYLYNHSKTRRALGEWAAGKDLIVAGFFFWTAGTSMQKSQQGLLQSLLMCILKQRPALISHLCPDRWNAQLRIFEGESWTKSELLEALTRLKAVPLDSARLCIFIDGLDEYEGEMLDLLRLTKDLTTSGSIKVCVSCRPWNVFEKFFEDNGGKRISLQDLNKPDIKRFAYERLTEEIDNCSNPMDNTEYDTLAEEIVERSSGVFLWVFLVVRSLIRGMTNLDTTEELRARLRELPTELEKFFRHILDRGDRVYDKQAARIYILQLKARDPALSSLDLAYFAEEDQFYALRDEVSSRHAKMVEQLDKITRTRVLARCQDLLEFGHYSRLHFLHRTVKDFLETGDMFDELTRRAGEGFNGDIFICNSMLVQMKAMLQHHGPGGPITLSRAQLSDRVYAASYFMDSFLHHIQNHVGRLCSELILAFDETLYSIYGYTKSCRFCWYLWHDMFPCKTKEYHKGLLVDLVVGENGFLGVLHLQIGKTNHSIHKNEIWQKSPLEKVLIYMRSGARHGIVQILLNNGADPNEINCENNSVWESYLVQLEWPSISNSRYEEIRILEMLLRHGADPNLFFNKNAKSYELLSMIASDRALSSDVSFQMFIRRVSDFLSVQRPELPMRPNKRVLDNEDEEPSKRRKEAPSEPPS